MDALKQETVKALEHVICISEGLLSVKITQDLEKEELVIEDQSHGLTTYMNCRFNSVGATIRQLCKHINNKTLFSFAEEGGLHNWTLN